MPQFNSYPLAMLPLTGFETVMMAQQQGAAIATVTATVSMLTSSVFIVPTGGSPPGISLGDFGANILLANSNFLFNTVATNTANAALAAGGALYASGYVAGQESNTVFGVGTPISIGSGAGVQGTFYGYAAGFSNSGGSSATAYGFGALYGGGAGQDTAIGARALLHGSGGFNTALGSNAGAPTTSGSNSIMIGHGTIGGLDYVPFGSLSTNGYIGTQNTAVGTWAFQGLIGGNDNIAIGTYCARLYNCYLTPSGSRTSGSVFIGDNIGYSGLGQGGGNVCIGTGILYNSGSYTTTSSFLQTVSTLSYVGNSTIVGYQSLMNATNGSHVGVGYQVLQAVTTGQNLTACGYQALNSTQTDNHSSAFGYHALYNMAGGGFNSAFGSNSLVALTTGASNSGFGYSVLLALTTGGSNCGFGNNAGNALTSGSSNVIMGQGAGQALITASQSIAIGASAFSGTGDYSNTISIGYNTNPTGSNQIVLGNSSILSFYIGGTSGGLAYVKGNNNAYGDNSLASVTTGVYLNAHGYNALTANTTGTYNSAFGHGTLAANTVNSDCSAFGYLALNVSTAARNTAFGSNAGAGVIGGSNNVLMGAYCGTGIVAGNYNVIIGDGANTLAAGVDCSNSIIIGRNIQASASNQIIIGSSAQSVSLGGSLTIGTGAAGAAVFGGSLTCASILGNALGVAPATGVIGSTVSSTIIAASSIAITTSGTSQNVTSITLPAGVWNVTASIGFSPAGSLSQVRAAISSTSATLPTQPNGGGSLQMAATFTSASGQFFPGMIQLVLITPAMVSGSTNVIYLVGQATFGSTCNFYGQISAELRG